MIRLFLIVLLLPLLAHAADEPKSMMRTLTITPPDAPAEEKAKDAEDEEESPATAAKVDAPRQDGKPLPYYPPFDQLEPWPYLKGLYLPAGTAEYRAAMLAIAQAPGEAPPIAMLQAAGALLEEGRLADAAFFHQGALLRAAFDARRFPDSPEKEKFLATLSAKAGELNEPVYQYLLQSPEILMASLTKVVEWDRRTRYAYDPGFPIAPDFKAKGWYKMHAAVQAEFLARWSETGATLWPQRKDDIDKNLSKILDK